MIIAVDFDDTIVSQAGRDYADVTSPLRLMPGAEAALKALRRAGHVLLLYSARASRALLDDPRADPLVRAGARRVNPAQWERMRPIHEARYRQMLQFVDERLPGIFAAIDDGRQGKPVGVDMFIDDKALRYGTGVIALGWGPIAGVYGEPVYAQQERHRGREEARG